MKKDITSVALPEVILSSTKRIQESLVFSPVQGIVIMIELRVRSDLKPLRHGRFYTMWLVC